MGDLPGQGRPLEVHASYRHGIAFSESPLNPGAPLSTEDLVACSVLSGLNEKDGKWWLKHFGKTSTPPYWIEPRGEWALYIDGWRSCKWIATTLGS